MTDKNQDILEEIDRLREDVRQLREVVNILVNVVMEEEMDEEDEDYPAYIGKEGRFNLLN